MALLPKDLQRFQIDGPHAVPQYIKPTPAVVQTVEQILDCFRYSPDDTYGNLCDALEPLSLQSQRHRLIKGLIHILEDRLEFDDAAQVDPVAVREALFTRASQVGAAEYAAREWRDRIVRETAEQFGITPEQLETAFYADLRDERHIRAFEDIETDELIALYNLTLAKSLLLYARSLQFTVDLGDATANSLRRMFRSLRFFNLLFDAQPIAGTIWQFTVDGPTSVLPQPQKYAASLAAFLPTLYAFSAWHATASLEIDGKPCDWQLKPDDFAPPTMRFPERIPEEARQLAERIPQIAPEWLVSYDYPVVSCGAQAVWVPDFSVVHATTHRVAHVEVMGFWRADYLNRRMEQLKKAPKNLILVLSDKLQVDAAARRDSQVTIIPFRRTPRPQDVVKAADACALAAPRK